MSNIYNKKLTNIATTIINSFEYCDSCKIKDYCNKIIESNESRLCEYVWEKWLYEKLKENGVDCSKSYYDGYQQGRADGYSQAEKDYFANSQKDREDTYNCGYAIGKADAISEFWKEFGK